MKNRFLLLVIMLAPVSVSAGEMGTGHGVDGPNAAPTDPIESESASASLWEQIAEWFEVVDSE